MNYEKIKGHRSIISKKNNLLIAATKNTIEIRSLKSLVLKQKIKGIKETYDLFLNDDETLLYCLSSWNKIEVINLIDFKVEKDFKLPSKDFKIKTDLEILEGFYLSGPYIILHIMACGIVYICLINTDNTELKIVESCVCEDISITKCCVNNKTNNIYLLCESDFSKETEYLENEILFEKKYKILKIDGYELTLKYLSVLRFKDTNYYDEIIFIDECDNYLILKREFTNSSDVNLVFVNLENNQILLNMKISEYDILVFHQFNKNFKKHIITLNDKIIIYDIKNKYDIKYKEIFIRNLDKRFKFFLNTGIDVEFIEVVNDNAILLLKEHTSSQYIEL